MYFIFTFILFYITINLLKIKKEFIMDASGTTLQPKTREEMQKMQTQETAMGDNDWHALAQDIYGTE